MNSKERGSLRSKMDQHSPSLEDGQYDWTSMGPGIMDGLNQKEERRRPIWIYFFGLAMLFLFSSVMYQQLVKSTSSAKLQEDSSDETAVSFASRRGEELTLNSVSSQSREQTTDSDARVRITSLPLTHGKDVLQMASQNNDQDNDMELLKEVPTDLSAGIINAGTFDSGFSSRIIDEHYASTPSPAARLLLEGTDALAYLYSDKVYASSSRPLLSIDALPDGEQLEAKESVLHKRNHLSFSTGYSSFIGSIPFYESVGQLGMIGALRYSRAISPKWYVSTGVQVNQLRYQASLSTIESTQLYRPSTVDTVFSLRGEVVQTTTTDSIPGTRSRVFRHSNSLTSVSIPVSFGFRKNYGLIDYYVGLGAVVSMTSVVSGRLVNVGNSTIDVASMEYRTFGAVQPFVEAGAGYRLNGAWSLQAGFQLQHHFAGTDSQLWMDQAMTSYNVQLGLKYSW